MIIYTLPADQRMATWSIPST